jgi:predicted amidohydrolase
LNGFSSMGSKINRREVEKIVDRLEIFPSDNLAVCSSQSVTVAALQMQAKPYGSLAEYVVDMNLYIADAVNRRAQLICLPAFAGLLPMSFAPHFQAHRHRLIPTGNPECPVDPHGLNEVLSYLSDATFDAYFYTMSVLAARHSVYIMTGSTLYFEENELCHRAFLLNEEGELVGYQGKIAESPLEQELQIPPETEVKLFETPMGPVSILIGSDAYHFECARIASRLGAKMILCPNAFLDEYTPVDSSLGPNMRAQENRIYAVQSSLVGETGLGFTLEGGGRIFAPNELLRHKNGVIAKTLGRHQPDIACISLDLDRLDAIRNPYTQDKNPQFMQKYIDRLY